MKHKILSFLLAGFALPMQAQQPAAPFHAIVAADGSGHYRSIQEAVDAAPKGRTEPWLILVKNGSYAGQVIIPESKPYIHLIGQDPEKTTIHLRLNVGGKPTGQEADGKTAYWRWSVHNPESPVYRYEGTVVMVRGPHFYTAGISYVNDWGTESFGGPQALAMSSQADCAAFYRCRFRSFQDTWMTTTDDRNRHYVKDCLIEGAVDYFYGGGDVLLENCTLRNVRSGSVIVAPCHKEAKFGYAFRDCVVDGTAAAADGRLKLGRPWHNSPRAVFINTQMRIPVAPEGWNNMGAIPALFAEWNSRDAQGNPIDLSRRKTAYQYTDRRTGQEQAGTCPATLTREEAGRYCYENMMPGTDGWNPRALMEELPAPRKLSFHDGRLSWQPVKEAAGYVVFDGERIVGAVTGTSCPVAGVECALKVCAVNRYGTLGKTAAL